MTVIRANDGDLYSYSNLLGKQYWVKCHGCKTMEEAKKFDEKLQEKIVQNFLKD